MQKTDVFLDIATVCLQISVRKFIPRGLCWPESNVKPTHGNFKVSSNILQRFNFETMR